ncbi:MAG: LamG domain-containing protein [Verrucomicrobiales bacterium]|nr:LamG domain-containing protein [Verrucomicrobiales bacterium]
MKEHARLFEGRLCALRDDLNGSGTTYNYSAPHVLLKYRESGVGEWRMKAFRVERGTLAYPVEAGFEIQPPFPLNVLPLCDSNRAHSGPLYRDHAGRLYAYAAGRGNAHATAVIHYWYPLQSGFFFDANGDDADDNSAGTCVPWLSGSASLTAPPANVTYDIRWPDNIPVLPLGATHMQAKDNLPEIFKQARAQIIYDAVSQPGPAGPGPIQGTQDSFGTLTDSAVRLYDPLSERSVLLPSNFSLPAEVQTYRLDGRLAFKKLPYDLRLRLLYDDLNRKLIFRGFTVEKDQPPDDPLLLPNVMSAAERDAIEALEGIPNSVSSSTWQAKVDELYDLTRNPNRVDLNGDSQPDRELRLGLITRYEVRSTSNPTGPTSLVYAKPTSGLQIVNTAVVPEPLGSGPKALTAALPLSAAAANRLYQPAAGFALSFDGTDDAVRVDSVVGLDTGNAPHTVEMWIKIDQRPSSATHLLTLGNTPTGAHQWWFDTTGALKIGIRSGVHADLGAYPVGEWLHLAAVYDGAGLSIYKNGVLHSITSLSLDLRGIPLQIGVDPAGTDGLAALDHVQIDELRVWSRARTAEQIKQDYNRVLSSESDDLVLYWKFDEGNALTGTRDHSQWRNDGAYAGGPSFQAQTSSTQVPNGYVTLVFNDASGLGALPVSLSILQVTCEEGPSLGSLRVLPSDNIFEEQIILRHSGDFGGEYEKFDFQWFYHPAVNSNGTPFDPTQLPANDQTARPSPIAARRLDSSKWGGYPVRRSPRRPRRGGAFQFTAAQ